MPLFGAAPSALRAVRELRGQIEGFAARRAAQRVADGASAAPLGRAFQRMVDSAGLDQPDAFANADLAFHRAVLDLADVDGLVEAWDAVHAHEVEFHRRTIELCWPDLAMLVDIHRPIVDAVCAGDAVTAEEPIRLHLEFVWYRLDGTPYALPTERDPLEAACAHLALHLHEKIRLETVARFVSRTSASHLARLFRERRGMSFTAYLQEIRLRRAAELLARSMHAIGQVAERVGYLDASRFSEHFRRRFGMSPRTYRKRFGEDSAPSTPAPD